MDEKPSESQQPPKESEIDRYERLQLAAESQIKRIGDAYETHSNLIKTAGYLFVACAGIIITLGGIFFFHSISEMEDKATSKVQNQIEIMTNTVDAQLADADIRVKAAIEEHFQKEKIDLLLARKVDQVTEKIINDAIHRQIDPSISSITHEISDITHQMSVIGDELSQAERSGNDVKNGLGISMEIIAALNDDREAFNKIHEGCLAGTNIYQHAMLDALGAVLEKQQVEDLAFDTKAWSLQDFNAETNSFDGYVKCFNGYQTQGAIYQAILLQKLSEQARFPRAQKLVLYLQLLRQAKSLKVLSRTCQIVSAESQIKMNVLGVPVFIGWVKHEINMESISNSTVIIRTNQNDVTALLARSLALSYETNYVDSTADLKKSFELAPTNASILNCYAWILATCPDDEIRNGKLAVDLAERACKLTDWKLWNCVGTLAAAYAEAGDFEQAVKYEKQAIGLNGINDQQIADETHRMQLFEQKKPTHETPDF